MSNTAVPADPSQQPADDGSGAAPEPADAAPAPPTNPPTAPPGHADPIASAASEGGARSWPSRRRFLGGFALSAASAAVGFGAAAVNRGTNTTSTQVALSLVLRRAVPRA